MTSLLSLVLVLGASNSTISFEPLDGGVEVGPPAWPESTVVKGLKNDSGSAARLERQKLLFAAAERTSAEIAADPKAPVVDLVNEGLKFVQLAETRRKRPTVELQAIDLIALLARFSKDGERKVRVANFAMWFERNRGVDETESALAAIGATAELAAFKKVRKAYVAFAATEDDSVVEKKTAEALASSVDAFAALETSYRKKLDVWLRAKLAAGELPLAKLPNVPGTVLARHPFRLTDVVQRDGGLYFLSWEQSLGYRRSIERIDSTGVRSTVAVGLDIHHDFQPWRGTWAWVDSRGTLTSLTAEGAKEELSFAKYVVQQFIGGEEVDVMVLATRREAPKDEEEAWALVLKPRDQAPITVAHGAGGVLLHAVAPDGRVVLRVAEKIYLFDTSRKQKPVAISIPEGATYWLDGKLVVNANPLMGSAQFLWVDLKSGVTTKFAEAPMGIVTQDPNVIHLTAGFKVQQISVLDGKGGPIPLGEWPFVLSVLRDGDDFIVATVDPTLDFGAISRVPRPAPKK